MKESKPKKLTNAQLQKRLANAIVHVDKTKDTQSVFFDDKGLRLTVSEDYAVIETGYHRHVFNNFTNDGVSRPWLYTRRMVEITNATDCRVGDGLSYQRLMQVLKEKEDKSDYNVATYFDWYLFNVFNPLYSIGENEAQTFMVYMDYMHNIAKNAILFDEHKDGLTNKQFIEQWIEKIKEFTKGMEERVLFEPKTDEQLMQENIKAIKEQENEQILQEQIQNEEPKKDD